MGNSQSQNMVGTETHETEDYPQSNSIVSLASHTTLEVKPHIDKYWTDYVVERIAAAIDLPFAVTPNDLQVMNEILSPIVVKVPPGVTYPNSHPLEATLLYLCEDFFQKKGFNGKVLEVGANPRSIMTNKHRHFCNPLTGRDEARIRSAMAEDCKSVGVVS